MSVNFLSDDSSDDSSTCFGSESGGSEKSMSMPHIDVLESTVTSTSASSTAPSGEASFFTPVVTKKKIRRTNAQIQADTAAETAEKMIRGTTTRMIRASSATGRGTWLSTLSFAQPARPAELFLRCSAGRAGRGPLK